VCDRLGARVSSKGRQGAPRDVQPGLQRQRVQVAQAARAQGAQPRPALPAGSVQGLPPLRRRVLRRARGARRLAQLPLRARLRRAVARQAGAGRAAASPAAGGQRRAAPRPAAGCGLELLLLSHMGRVVTTFP